MGIHVLIFLYFLEFKEPDFFSGNPLFILNPLFVPFFYTDSINDFSPNYYYKNLHQKFVEIDSQSVITRFLLFRSAFNTEQNNVSSFFPLFENKLKSLIFISIHKNKLYYNFAKHNYYFFFRLTPFPLNFEYSIFDANPFNNFQKLEKFEFTFNPLSFSIFYSQENSKRRKLKYGINFRNNLNHFFYSITFSNYKFLLTKDKKNFNNLKIETSLFFNFTDIEIGSESKNKRFTFESGLKFKHFKFSYFIEKPLFPFCFDSLTDYFDDKKNMKRNGLKFDLSFKYKKSSFLLLFEYFNSENHLYLSYPFKMPKLLSGNFFSIFTCDTLYFFDFLRFFIKFKMLRNRDFYKEIYSISLKFFIFKNKEKNYFLYLIKSFDSFDRNYLLKIILEGKFYSSFLISFSYSNPLKGNFFYFENYDPVPFYSVMVSTNIYD
ncbi:MAG: hypothetical protein ABDH37_00555 [Candidatus Hydrothermales bacterium]